MSDARPSPRERDAAETGGPAGCTVRLHPSVRFYRGVWGMSQLADPTFTDGSKVDASRRSAAAASSSSSTSPSPAAASLSPRSLSVVGLHQTLLPPAAVDGLGEVADESYAAQLASTDGLEYLRLRWHLLLPLLFPTGRPLDEAASERSRLGGRCGDDDETEGREGEEEGAPPPESRWTTTELYTQVMGRQLTSEDLCILREPGLMDRVYYSYVVLLRFFGWRVHDESRGLLDRHRGWHDRYTALAQHRQAARVEGPNAAAAPGGGAASGTPRLPLLVVPEPPRCDNFDFYRSGLPRVLRSLLDVGFLRLGVRLVEFVLEELKSQRLAFLLPLVEEELLPMVEQDPNVEGSHKTRLAKRLYQLTHSDSD